MAWSDVPTKLTKYDGLKYAPDNASTEFVLSFTQGVSSDPDDVPVNRQAELEAALDYRIGACENLALSKAMPRSQTKHL